MSTGQRRLIVRALRAVIAPPIVTANLGAAVIYPPSDQTRDDMVSAMHGWLGRTYAEPADFGLDQGAWDAAIARAADILRNV